MQVTEKDLRYLINLVNTARGLAYSSEVGFLALSRKTGAGYTVLRMVNDRGSAETLLPYSPRKVVHAYLSGHLDALSPDRKHIYI